MPEKEIKKEKSGVSLKSRFFTKANIPNLLLLLGLIISIVLGTIGWLQYYLNNDKSISIFTAFYMTLQLFNLGAYPPFHPDVPVFLNIARFLMPLVLLTAFFKLFYSIIRTNLDNLKILRFKEHYIFCGFNDLTRQLISEIIQENKTEKIVIIDEKPEPEFIKSIFPRNVVLLKGDATEAETLKAANLYKAKRVMLLNEDDDNLEIVRQIKNLCSEKSVPSGEKKVILVNVKFTDAYNIRLFKDFHSEKSVTSNEWIHLDFHAVDTEQLIATAIVDDYHPAKKPAILDQNAPAAHIIIMGFNTLGQKILTEAAHIYHFPNLKKLKITVIDEGIEEKFKEFELEFPSIREIIDVSLLDLSDMLGMKGTTDLADILACFVSYYSDGECIQRSLQLRQFLFNKLKNVSFPEIVTIIVNGNFTKDFDNQLSPLKEIHDKHLIQIVHINKYLYKQTIINAREKIDQFAQKARERRITEENAKALKDVKETGKSVTVTKKKKEWDEFTDREKDSSRYPARHTLSIKLPWLKLNKVTTLFEKQDQPSDTGIIIGKMEHLRWNAEKLLSGFVKGDDTFSQKEDKFITNTLKYHFCICPWGSLSLKYQNYDIKPTEDLLDDLPKILPDLLKEAPELITDYPYLSEYVRMLNMAVK